MRRRDQVTRAIDVLHTFLTENDHHEANIHLTFGLSGAGSYALLNMHPWETVHVDKHAREQRS